MLVLATDLDGTFLGGPLAARDSLYQLLRSLEDEVELIFVTGRAVEHIKPVIEDPAIPDPRYIVADVGATVVDGKTLEPVEPLDRELGGLWVGEERVLAALPRDLSLERQQQIQVRRCSFYTGDPAVVERVAEVVRPLGCEVLYSAGRYLDVLPAGVSKGRTLERLIEHLGLAPEEVLVAGDSLNDLSVFLDTPFRGVVVGGSEPGLREATRGRDDTHHAESLGAAGILEALETFEFLTGVSPQSISRGKSDLVVVYHRQPFEEVEEQGRIRRRPPRSPNGILPTLLGLFDGGRRGAWVAWTLERPGATEPPEERIRLDGDGFSGLDVSRLVLREEDVDLFYAKFSKNALWPILHSFVERAEFDHRHWQHFLHINQLFAERAATEAAEGALVWIHDYNLWLVPETLRRLRPDLRIAFFHHTPFPAGDMFNVIPWSREILTSLLCCDHIGFHIPRYVENFVDAARGHVPLEIEERIPSSARVRRYDGALGIDEQTVRLRHDGRSITLGAHPVGLDLRRIRKIVTSNESADRIRRLEADLAAEKIIVCAERMDYTKGPLQKLLAFERFLALYPAWLEKITFINICVPPAPGMRIYDEIRIRVEQVVGRINGRFATPTWSPLTFMYRSVPFEELVTYLAVADVAWITPLRDGLNLVAKEYVAVRDALERSGVLIVSELAGSSVELQGALLTNPYDTTEMASTLQQAMLMDKEEQATRMRQLAEVVRTHDVEAWAGELLGAASARGSAENGRSGLDNSPGIR